MNPDLNDEQAGFESTYEEVVESEVDPTETPGNDAEDKVVDPAPAEQAAPEYAQITKAEYEELRARAALIDEIRATQDKSFGTFGRTIKNLSDKLEAFEAGSGVDIAQEDIDILRNDGLEPVAAALEKIRSLRSLPGAGMDPEKIDELVQQRLAPALSAVEQRFELRLLAKDHPDYRQVDADPNFSQFVAGLPADEKETLAQASKAYDSATVSEFMSRFKAQAKQAKPAATATTQQRASRLQAAETPRGTGKTLANIASDEQAGFDSV